MISNKNFKWLKCPITKTAKLDKYSTLGHYYYTPDGNYYESITTRLGHLKDKTFLNRWEEKNGAQLCEYIRQTSIEYGTKTHKMAEYYVKNKKYPFKKPLMPKAHFDNLKSEIDNCDNLYASEISLWNDELKLAGTADLVGEYDGQLAIIDFKTSKAPKRNDWIEDYFFQGAFYADCWNKLTKDNIETIVILISCETGDLQVIEINPNYWILKMKEKVLSGKNGINSGKNSFHNGNNRINSGHNGINSGKNT